MTSSIPDSISTSDLQNLISDAKPEVPAPSIKDADPKVQIGRVVDSIESLTDEWGTVFAYKLIADYCIHQLFNHHKEVASEYFKEGKEQISSAWSRDAGHFQVIGHTLRNIVCGSDDFMAPDQD